MKSRVAQLRASPATFHGLMDADRELGQSREPDLILAFLPPDGGAADTLEAMAEVWPTSRRLGCETTRQFADAEIGTSGCLLCFWLDGAGHSVEVEVLRGSHDSPPDETSLEAACRSLAGADAVLLLADGLRFPVRTLLTELRRHRASLPRQIAGVLASSQMPGEGDGAGARVFLDTEICPSACLVLGFRGVSMEHVLVNDYAPASPVYSVTRAEENTVHEIDGVSAVDWYRRFFVVDGQLAQMPQTANDFPLMIEGPDPSRRRLCRAMRDFDEPPGAVRYWGDVREGEQARLGISKEPSLVETAARMSAGGQAEAALFCAFEGREAMLGDRAEIELAELCAALHEAPLAGSFTFGEIGPGDGGALAFHNQTALLALFRENSS